MESGMGAGKWWWCRWIELRLVVMVVVMVVMVVVVKVVVVVVVGDVCGWWQRVMGASGDVAEKCRVMKVLGRV